MSDDVSEKTAIANTLEGNSRAFEYIVKKYKNYIYTIIIRNNVLGTEADELFQDVFLKAFEKLKSYKDDYSFKNWIFTIALNHIRNYRRKRYLAGMLPFKLGRFYQEAQETPQADTGLENEINRALADLARPYFSVIMLYYYENKTYEEISVCLDKPIGTVKIWLSRAKKILQKKLKQHSSFFV